MAPKKRPTGTVYKFNKSVDIGPQDYSTMDRDMAEVIHQERIRRQIQSRMGIPPRKK